MGAIRTTLTGFLMYSAEHIAYSPLRWLLTGETRFLSCDWRQRCGLSLCVKGIPHTIKRLERIGILIVTPPGLHIPMVCFFKSKDVMLRVLAEVPCVGDCLGLINALKLRNIPMVPLKVFMRVCPVYHLGMCLLTPLKFLRPRWFRPVQQD